MKSTLTFFFSLLLLISCQDPVDDKGAITWTVLQKNILKPNCSNCHMAGSAIERQSGLDLSSNDSYDSLVDVAPKNSAANKDGLLIVSSEGGMKGLTKSYLWEKINAYDQEHFLSDHPEYGQLMPPGGNFLSDGELQFIRSWIEAGAPKSGNVVDENLLLDTNKYEPKPFSKPEPPTSGIQLHLGPFEIQPNYEREFFQYTELNHTGDLYVNRIEIEMRPGSHHFLLYTFNENTPQQIIPNYGDIRDLRDRYGATNLSTLYTMQFHKFFGGTQWSRLDYVLPDGVALKIPAKYGLDQNTHYVNRTDSTMIGEVYTNIHLIEQNLSLIHI